MTPDLRGPVAPGAARARALALTTLLALVGASCSSGVDAPGSAPAPVDATTTATASAAATTSTPTSTTAVDPEAQCVAALPLHQRAAQLVGIAIDGGALPSEAARVAGLGVGLVLVQRATASGLADGIAQVRQASAIAPFVAVDEEGGEVQHLRDVVGPLLSERSVASGMDGTAAAGVVGPHYQAVADLGFDVVFGPVVDVASPGGGGPLGDRTFSDDPATVAAYGQVYVDAVQAAGMLPVLKHFPGLGSGTGNSDDGPVATPAFSSLQARDLLPYQRLAADPPVGVMVGHLNVPGLSDDIPTSLSPAAYDLLRDDFGFDGIAFTDSLSSGAIAATIPPDQAAVRAIAAGADLALFVTIADPAAVITALEAAVGAGTLPVARVDDAVGRILSQKGVDACSL